MRFVVAIGFDEAWSAAARLVAYGAYAQAAGFQVVFALTRMDREVYPLNLAAFSPTLDAPVVELLDLDSLAGDTVIFAAPKVHHIVQSHYGNTAPRFVHLIQSGLTASAVADLGYGYRLFHKPMTRIVVTRDADDTIGRLVEGVAPMTRIDAAFDLSAFREPAERDRPLTFAINTFDGKFALRALHKARDRGLSISAHMVTPEMSVKERAAAYRASHLLVASPRVGEGICQPAWEAMAAGCAVIIPDGEALRTLPSGTVPVATVRQSHFDGMVETLIHAAGRDRGVLTRLGHQAQNALSNHNPDHERAAATALLGRLGRGEMAA
ncbi:MAG: hypothetical protein AAGB11_14640 [Pseudomonadota bacterium]